MRELFEKEITRLIGILAMKTELHEISSLVHSIEKLVYTYHTLERKNP